MPSDVVFEKGDVIDRLCGLAECDPCDQVGAKEWVGIGEMLCPMRIREMNERETYTLPDRDTLIKEQGKEEYFMELKEQFFSLPEAEQGALLAKKEGFFVKDDILFRREEAPSQFASEKQLFLKFNIQICVPRTLRRAVLYSVHGLPISGHDGQQRSRVRLARTKNT